MQEKINKGQHRSALQRFLDDSILSFGLRYRILHSFSGALYHKDDSFVIPGGFYSCFPGFGTVILYNCGS